MEHNTYTPADHGMVQDTAMYVFGTFTDEMYDYLVTSDEANMWTQRVHDALQDGREAGAMLIDRDDMDTLRQLDRSTLVLVVSYLIDACRDFSERGLPCTPHHDDVMNRLYALLYHAAPFVGAEPTGPVPDDDPPGVGF